MNQGLRRRESYAMLGGRERRPRSFTPTAMPVPSANLPTSGVCGMYCRACGLYLGSTEEPRRLAAFAERSGKPLDEVRCHGCQSDLVASYCRTCKLRNCALGKGLTFCAECADFPCADFSAFAARDLTGQVLANCKAIRGQGWQSWYEGQALDHACPSCGTINSIRDLTCRRCGHDPSCAFVGRHREAAIRLLGEDR